MGAIDSVRGETTSGASYPDPWADPKSTSTYGTININIDGRYYVALHGYS